MAKSGRWCALLSLSAFVIGCGSSMPEVIICQVPAGYGLVQSAQMPAATPTPRPVKSTKTTAPKPSASKKPATTRPADKADPADPGTDAPKPQPAKDGLALLEAVKDATLNQAGMEGVITSYEMKADKSASNNSKFKLWMSGNSYRLENIAHTKANNVGSKVVLHYGKPDARVKPAGFLSVVTVTLPLADKNLISLNNLTLDQILLHGVLDRALGGDCEAEVAGTTTIGSDKITIVKVTNVTGKNKLHPDVDYEYIGFDENHIYRLWAAYAKPELGLPQGNLLYQITVPEATPGVNVPASKFEL